MAFTRSLLSEEQFQCSICLDVLTQPVSTPCGHNFCKACIRGYWDSTDLCQCPICKEMFYIRPELKTNTTLREVTDKFKKMRARERDEVPAEPGEVACDICTGRKLKALKSCLVCLASYCETHLQPHQIAPALMRHKMINPVENLGDRMCNKHNRLLELFCRTDQMCVCQFCTETDHKTHHTVPLEEECGERKAQLWKTEAQVQQLISERQQKVQEIRLSVELRKIDAEKEIVESLEVFTALMRSIERSQNELIEVVEKKWKAAERQAEVFIKELEQEITELQKRRAELEKLSHTEDHLHLLQNSPSLSPPTLIKDWSEISVNNYLCVGNLRRAVSQLEETITSEVEKLCDAELKRMQQWSVDVTLDPDTANAYLNLSEDGKQVRVEDQWLIVPDKPERFDRVSCVLGKEGFSSGRFYYVVQVKEKTQWDLGVVKESINRKGIHNLNTEAGYWTVGLRNGEYWAAAKPSVRLSLRLQPQKVGVFVDYEEGLVSFYDVENRSPICFYTGCTFTEKLYPFFSPCNNDGGTNSAPLIISPVNHSD